MLRQDHEGLNLDSKAVLKAIEANEACSTVAFSYGGDVDFKQSRNATVHAVSFSCAHNVCFNHSCNSTIHTHQKQKKDLNPHIHLPGFYNTHLLSYINKPAI